MFCATDAMKNSSVVRRTGMWMETYLIFMVATFIALWLIVLQSLNTL
jgi:hypothetical protein